MALGGLGIFFITLFVLILIAYISYIVYIEYNARKRGLPKPSWFPFLKRRSNPNPRSYQNPSPAPGGIIGWFNDKIASIRNRRTAGGAYEHTSYNSGVGGTPVVGRGGAASGGRHGFGPLDPDEAWDARVDHETSGYYEEQEMGDASGGMYHGTGYSNAAQRQRELDSRYDEEMHGGAAAGPPKGAVPRENPFGDHAAVGASPTELRSVSPRPAVVTQTQGAAQQQQQQGHKKGNPSVATLGSADENSPLERRSMFREDV